MIHSRQWRAGAIISCFLLTTMLVGCGDDTTPQGNAMVEADTGQDQDDMPQEDLGAGDTEDEPDAVEDIPEEPACPDAQTECAEDASACGAFEVCEAGCCVPFVCSANADCEQGLICVEGACVSPPAADGLQARLIYAPSPLASMGEGVAVAYDPIMPAVVVPEITLSWESEQPDVLTVDETGTLICMMGGEATVRVRVAENDSDPGDTGVVRCLEGSDDPVNIYLVDEESGLPIEGATVVMEVEGAEGVQSTSGASGRASFGEDPADALINVSVFAEGYQYVSVMQTGQRSLLIPVGRIVDTTIALDPQSEELSFDGLRGVDVIEGKPDFTQVANRGELEVALTGFGIKQGLLDLNFELIIGPNIEQFLPPTPGLPIPTDEPLEIPGGVTLAYNNQPVVGRYLLTAPAGERTMWSLGGRISLSENPQLLVDILGSIGGELDIGRIVAAILPLFENFYSGLRPGVTLTEEPVLPPRQEDIALRVPTGLNLTLETPALPQIGARTLDGVLMLGGALVPGQGFLPTGVTATLDDPDAPTGTVDPVNLYMSPLHGGLENPGARYVVATVALSFSAFGGGGDGKEATSILLSAGAPGASIQDGMTPGREEFLNFDDSASYDLETRTLRMTPVDGADMKRVVFEAEGGARWVIWAPAEATEVSLPSTEAYGVEGPDPASRATGRVVQIDLRQDGGADFESLVSADGQTLRDLIENLGALSILEL